MKKVSIEVAIIDRAFDLMWAYPVYMLGIELFGAHVLGGLDLGLCKISDT